ncbi:hypothetical protein [Mesorhizobium sp. M0030]|uniref:hypothetical protein n=1 Tax=Mesorhizobium sp. M0030 TaxID=2956851 RepID=UPI00333C0E34
MIIDPGQDWLPSHGVLDNRVMPSLPFIGIAEEVPTPFVRPFTLAKHFTRGGYAGSLHAGSSLRARQWRGQWLRGGLPLLPLDQRDSTIEPAHFWPLLAELNGQELGKVQRALRLDSATLARAVAIAEQRGLLFSLPFWTPPDVTNALFPLRYWRDSALVADLQRRREVASRVTHWDEKRWEGFVIAALTGAAGVAVRARDYRIGQDEIDLVLNWPQSRRPWAIEISASRRKKLSPGNWRAFEEIEADRLIVVDAGPEGRVCRVRGEEPMRLIEALREVRTGP